MSRPKCAAIVAHLTPGLDGRRRVHLCGRPARTIWNFRMAAAGRLYFRLKRCRRHLRPCHHHSQASIEKWLRRAQRRK